MIGHKAKEFDVADDKILEIKNFKKVNGDLIILRGKKSKKSKKKANQEATQNDKKQPDYAGNDMDFEEEFLLALEENQFLHIELIKEQTRSQTLQKILNKLLKQYQIPKEQIFTESVKIKLSPPSPSQPAEQAASRIVKDIILINPPEQ